MTTSFPKNKEIDLIQFWPVIRACRKKIVEWALIGAAAGLVVAFSFPGEYKVAVKMVPEQSAPMLSGMSGLAAIAGVSLSDFSQSENAVTVDVYPEIVQSTLFLIDMARISVTTKKGETFTLYEYIQKEIRFPWWGYIFRFPGMLLEWIPSIGKEKEDEGLSGINPYRLTFRQSGVLHAIQKRIGVEYDEKSRILTAFTTMQDPLVATVICDSLTAKLEEYVIYYRTEKAKRNLIFIEELYADAQTRYHDAQKKYAAYVDSNQNMALQSVRIEQERLQNEQNGALSLFNQMRQQKEAAKIKVQEDTPCVTIIEPASVPLRKSNMRKSAVLVLFSFLFGFAVTGAEIIRFIFTPEKKV